MEKVGQASAVDFGDVYFKDQYGIFVGSADIKKELRETWKEYLEILTRSC